MESALGQLIEGVLVDDPGSLVNALGELGDGHIALVASADAEVKAAPTSLAARVRGPAAIRRLLAHLHGAKTCPRRRPCRQPSGRRFDHHPERRAPGPGLAARVALRCSPAGALLREREINELREQIEQLQDREAELEEQLAGFREQLQAAETAARDAQRALYQAHRAVSELAGQLQGQQGKVELHARASTASKAS